MVYRSPSSSPVPVLMEVLFFIIIIIVSFFCVVFVLLEHICIIKKNQIKRICIASLHLAVCRLLLLHSNKTYLKIF